MKKRATVTAIALACALGSGSAYAAGTAANNTAASPTPVASPSAMNPAASPATDGLRDRNTYGYDIFNNGDRNDSGRPFARAGEAVREGVRETGNYTANTVRAATDTTRNRNWGWLGLLGLIGLAGLGGRSRNEA
ncbi:WGxxGxxG family protein [Paenibacillus thermoaerophilus]|uniref:WGxxGxxG family protein n=1 Tax=Paenibacillus thermoaerophilus TaxID=1215385 RepID=A0ABW2V6B8_9BACL|nr:WGxxGxxG family protein [Paenibacillus thermoaerophilus]